MKWVDLQILKNCRKLNIVNWFIKWYRISTHLSKVPQNILDAIITPDASINYSATLTE